MREDRGEDGEHPETAEFAPPEPSPARLAAAASYTRVVAGDNDPYCPGGAAARYAEPLGLPVDVLPGEAHLDPDAGYGSWPSVFDWCLDPSPESYEKKPIHSRGHRTTAPGS